MVLDSEGLPQILPIFHLPDACALQDHYQQVIRSVLKKTVPNDFFREIITSKLSVDQRAKRVADYLPVMTSSPLHDPPTNISFSLLARLRHKTCRFFFEMISSWLVPGTSLSNVLFYAADFRMPHFGGPQVYTISQMIMRVEDPDQLEQIRNNLPILEAEILVGVRSAYHARRILEIKGWSADQQTAEIHEMIAHLVSRLPRDFDQDVFTEMQHVLVSCSDEFKGERDCRQLSRIISVFYLFRKALREAVMRAGSKRHLMLKLYKTSVRGEDGCERFRVCMVVGVSFLRDKEVLEERHLLRAVRKHFHKVRGVEGSFLSQRRGSENIATLYLEIDKADGLDWTSDELNLLKRQLPQDFKDHVEHLVNPVFNPRNEEEIMRNVLALGNQIKYVRDLPQVHVSFDEQSDADLFFTVIVARVVDGKKPSIRELFREAQSPLEYIHDRCRRIGMLRRKYPKEASIFRVKLAKEDFLREDHSIDVYKARQAVVTELQRILGDLRDYNGGMIAKQNDLLDSVRKSLQEQGPVNNFLLENFFYALTPVIMRSVMEPAALCRLYQMFLQAFSEGFQPHENFYLRIQEDVEFLYVVVVTEDVSLRNLLDDAIQALDIAPTSLATTYVTYGDIPSVGYIYRSDNKQRRCAFQDTIRSVLENLTTRAQQMP